MRLLRELSRRKLRTTLTIVGITIGIWALVVFSSLANQINGLVGSGSEFFADKIVVTDGESFGTSPMRLAEADTIAALDGVAAVDPQIEFLWDPDPAVGFGAPDLVTGLIPGADAGYETFELELATGTPVQPRARGQKVVLVTHDPEVGATCDRIIRMRDGRIVHDERVAPVGLVAA